MKSGTFGDQVVKRCAWPLFSVVLITYAVDWLTLFLFPSLAGNPYFMGYREVLRTFRFHGHPNLWVGVLFCALTPLLSWQCHRLLEFPIFWILRRKRLRGELVSAQISAETMKPDIECQDRDQRNERDGDESKLEAPGGTTSQRMTIVILSDHTGAQIHKAEQLREAKYLADVDQYDQAKERLKRRRESAVQTLGCAWRERRIWGTLHGLLDWMVARRAAPLASPLRQKADRQETLWAAGHEGEQLVMDQLERQLSGSWTVATGYRNQKGEIDLVAVGPDGIVALEIKYLNGVVHCDGDQWSRDKYDRYGNLVESGLSIVDKGGRTPSRQLNEAADNLQAFLHRRGFSGHVLRIVVFSHHMSRLGRLQNQTVDWICTVRELNLPAYCRGRCTQNSPAEIAKIVSLVRQDHADHNQPRATMTARA